VQRIEDAQVHHPFVRAELVHRFRVARLKRFAVLVEIVAELLVCFVGLRIATATSAPAANTETNDTVAAMKPLPLTDGAERAGRGCVLVMCFLKSRAPDYAEQGRHGLQRRQLLKLTGVAVATGTLAAAGSTAAHAEAKARPGGKWDKTFARSTKVDHEKVSFKNPPLPTMDPREAIDAYRWL
jgi:hypothetical protein